MRSNATSELPRSSETDLLAHCPELTLETRVQHFREDVDHVWRVHVLLLIVCASAVYLTLASWTGTRDVLPELQRFQRALEAIRRGRTQVDELVRLQGRLADHSQGTFEDAIRAVDDGIGFDRDVEHATQRLFWVRSLQVPSIDGATFDRVCEALRDVELDARELAGLTSATRLKPWVDKVRAQDFERIEVAGLEVGEPQDTRVTIWVDFEAIDRDGILSKQKGRFRLEFELMRGQVWSTSDFWAVFPRVRGWFEQSELEDETLDSALAKASTELTSELDDDLELGPLNLRGAHLGVLGPCLVLSISIYLLFSARALVTRLAGFPPSVRSYVRATSRWLPLRSASEARLAALLSDLALPAAAVGLPVWRLTAQPLGIAVALAIGAVALGWCTLALFLEPTGAEQPIGEPESRGDGRSEHLRDSDVPRPALEAPAATSPAPSGTAGEVRALTDVPGGMA